MKNNKHDNDVRNGVGRKESAIEMRKHAMQRALTRYGVSLTDMEYTILSSKIKTGDRSMFLSRKSKNVSVHVVWHKGIAMFALYDKNYSQIATFVRVASGQNYLKGNVGDEFLARDAIYKREDRK